MRFLNKLFATPKTREQYNADYLAKSVSMADLERRMGELDHKANITPFSY